MATNTYKIVINDKEYVVQASSIYQAHALAANLAAQSTSI